MTSLYYIQTMDIHITGEMLIYGENSINLRECEKNGCVSCLQCRVEWFWCIKTFKAPTTAEQEKKPPPNTA